MRSRFVVLLLGLAFVTPSRANAAVRTTAPARRAAIASDMAKIPAGWYRPLYAPTSTSLVHVGAFSIDREPVTREQYLRFVRANPRWARGAVPSAYAERTYLAEWPSATSAGSATDLNRPVTNISWFAANAYCAALGKRLPTVNEWERVATTSPRPSRDAGGQSDRRALLALYAARKPGLPGAIGATPANAYGVSDLHGLVWEWTLDVNTTAAASESHMNGGQHAHQHHLFCASAAIGATDPTDYPAFARYAVRAGLTARSTMTGLGFRCASGGAA